MSGKLAIVWNWDRLMARVEGRRKRHRVGERWWRIVDFGGVEVDLSGLFCAQRCCIVPRSKLRARLGAIAKGVVYVLGLL